MFRAEDFPFRSVSIISRIRSSFSEKDRTISSVLSVDPEDTTQIDSTSEELHLVKLSSKLPMLASSFETAIPIIKLVVSKVGLDGFIVR
jgi:hypothetical protein